MRINLLLQNRFFWLIAVRHDLIRFRVCRGQYSGNIWINLPFIDFGILTA